MFSNLSAGHLVLILLIVLLVFGASRLPQIGEGLGKAISNFKRGLQANDEIAVTPKEKRVADRSSAGPLSAEPAEAEVELKVKKG